jgi:hypothetical protein
MSSPVWADTLLFQRDMPITATYINNPTETAGCCASSRSNVGIDQTVQNGVPWVIGDYFSLAPSSTGYDTINSVTVYEVANGTTASNTPNQEFSNITLYGGIDPTGNGGSFSVSPLSSTYTYTGYQYAADYTNTGAANYCSLSNPAACGTAGQATYYNIYALTFSGLNWTVQTGVNYDFAVSGTPIGNNVFSLHATNALLSGAIEDDTDNSAIVYTPYQPNPTNLVATYAAGPGYVTNYANGADVNILINGTTSTPEPGTFALVGVGLLTGALLRRRKS